MTFFNTIGAKNPTLKEYETKTEKENRLILEIFKKRPGEWFTPFDIQDILREETGKEHLIGNIRRSLTTWANPKINALVKSETACAAGRYSKPNHLWTLAA